MEHPQIFVSLVFLLLAVVLVADALVALVRQESTAALTRVAGAFVCVLLAFGAMTWPR